MEQRNLIYPDHPLLEIKNKIPKYMLEEAGLGITRLKEHDMPATKIHDTWTFWVKLNIWGLMNK